MLAALLQVDTYGPNLHMCTNIWKGMFRKDDALTRYAQILTGLATSISRMAVLYDIKVFAMYGKCVLAHLKTQK